MDSGSIWKFFCIISFCALAFSSSYVAAEIVPTESECRPHIEKALNTIKADVKETDSAEISVDIDDSKENENILDSMDDIEDHIESSDEETAMNASNEVNDNEHSRYPTNEIDSDGTKDIELNENDASTEDQDSGEPTVNQSDSNEDSNSSKEEIESDIKVDEPSTEVDAAENESSEKSGEDNTDESEEQPQRYQSLVETERLNVNTHDDSKEVEQAEESQEEDDKKELSSKEENSTAKEENSLNENDSDSNENEENNSEEDTQEKMTGSDTIEHSHDISAKSYPVDDLLLESGIPENLRDRRHIEEILRLNDDSLAQNEALEKIADSTLKELKRIYENAIKPLETLYKYRDLSNRHFGDSEIFSKPLVLFMGPWSGGKSSIINYLTNNEYADNSLKTGAEPSHPYFNILMHGETEQVLDGTQLAADWTFSGLQKFGQGLQDRLRGLKLPSKLLERVNIVEIPGILEVRKHVSRVFPFNDACQWFIDRADIIFLVYDPSKLDVGPETEAILDQLKGREYQTRIILNKADQVHPEELLRVQSALIWNISPLMSSQQPPVMYTVSLWSNPFEENTPIRLLQAQEKALLQDLGQAIEHRIENKIASARRFAVRVRNHAKMVDCYLTTYYNHKTLFGNKKTISGEIVAHPQNYHIYEGLSTLTNISRYDLPDPDVYRDFFQLNPLYEFKKLSETCTYFRGCPINKLDVAIAYDLPELVNRYKRAVGITLNTLELGSGSNDSSTDRR